jgi:hypothetical protein
MSPHPLVDFLYKKFILSKEKLLLLFLKIKWKNKFSPIRHSLISGTGILVMVPGRENLKNKQFHLHFSIHKLNSAENNNKQNVGCRKTSKLTRSGFSLSRFAP